MFRLDNKVAAVTGAGSGNRQRHRQHVRRQRCARVRRSKPTSTWAKLRLREFARPAGKADAIACDVSSKIASVADAFAQVDRDAHRVDILINNAGIAHVGTVENTAEADFDRIYSVNVKGAYLCSQAGIKMMLRDGGGVILNLASIASLIGLNGSLRIFDEQGRGADDDEIDCGRIREAQHPLQLRVPGARQYAIRSR